ncbi:PREDICTED: EPIDERMAL PATTERNING FACTOR-like protein 2 [Ipomoea nil]|uniref:EPIDERMAL PATTERNING FACTOR-like protein 2 n=1 Tax=Ipomoea nil TaxID=35883 RepID=UPI0009011D9E|nr:PREDICTED: EPIDERMAL PATTERNING FACTOR-like protein 2 [Ipomoea nil]
MGFPVPHLEAANHSQLILMASLTHFSTCLKLGFTVALLLFLLPITECLEETVISRGVKVGSRPPRCTVDKCLNCRPCMATLVAPSHQRKYPLASYENYYLLAWKCKCGDKVFPP